ncbi:MAG: hypothetical protein K5981_06800 [Clostridia bacterium]|nr:hypothetical protein [Clostridia bacterium]
MKRFICIFLICALAVFSFAGCSKKAAKSPEQIRAEELREQYAALAESALALVDTYNTVAQTAKDNGWEADFETLKAMTDIADHADLISRAVSNPENMEEEQLETLKEEADSLIRQLNEEVAPKVANPCPAAEGTPAQ